MIFMRSLELILLVLLLLVGGCSYTKFKNSDSNFKNTPILSKAEREAIGYQKVKNEVLNEGCLSCHKSGKYPLDTYQKAIVWLNDIRNSVFIKGTMPKGKTLTSRQRSILLAWLDEGAPEFGKNAPDEPDLPPLQPTFSSIRDRIFKVSCSDCHDPASKNCQNREATIENDGEAHNKAACELELMDYNELLFGAEESRKELVIPGKPDESQLIFSIEREDGNNQMPPPEQGYSPLTSEEKKVIRDWISAGALNN